ncbi:MAG: glycosyltransferase family 10 fucosyltransferase [Tannerellaceae bacterium]|nr:glycosyltransferase family 10 fucosyltransferase [Tannerellaceae bacterium]
MPDLHKYLDDDITKVPGQVWISWNMECEENHLWMKDPEITQLFDITMDYHLASDIPCLYHRRFKEKLMQQQNPLEKQNKICMFISSLFNQSARQEYILELMKYVEIDSYGAWLNNKTLMEDSGRSTKLNIYSKYKFVIAFENAIYPDYVTEKFYHHLLAGAVPIYLGAPNIETFIPGENCFVNVNDFKEPKELASFLKRCYIDNKLYLNFYH